MGKKPDCRGFEKWVVKQLQLVAAVLSEKKGNGALKYIGSFLIL